MSFKNFPKYIFILSLFFLAVLYGMLAVTLRLPPYYQVQSGIQVVPQIMKLFRGGRGWMYQETPRTEQVTIRNEEQIQPGLTKIAYIANNNMLGVKVIDKSGKLIQDWQIDWFSIWSDAKHLTDAEIPKEGPGTIIHGAEIDRHGNLIFNFELLGLVKMDPCGNVLWRFPHRTHHSVYIDKSDNIWVPGLRTRNTTLDSMPNYFPPFEEYLVMKVSPDGELLEEKSVFDLLWEVNQQGLLYLTTRGATPTIAPKVPWLALTTVPEGDSLHLNDIEIYEGEEGGFFSKGDIMMSLRNVNAVLVFDKDWHLKYKWSNEFIRQHDPDFVDGNTLLLFDNHILDPVIRVGTRKGSSKILRHDVTSGETEIVFEGTPDREFYSPVMGKQQQLANGNVLVTEAFAGDIFELNPQNEVVWEYFNLVDTGWYAFLSEGERLPEAMDANFFAEARKQCAP